MQRESALDKVQDGGNNHPARGPSLPWHSAGTGGARAGEGSAPREPPPGLALLRTHAQEGALLKDFKFLKKGRLQPPSLQLLLSSVAVRLDKLSEVAKVNTDAIRLAQEEICEYRRQLQSKTTELEALKGTQESLERQRQDSEERHHADVLSYQVMWCSGQHPRHRVVGRDQTAAVEEQRWCFGFRDGGDLWQILRVVCRASHPQLLVTRYPEPEVASGLLCPSPRPELSHVSAWL